MSDLPAQLRNISSHLRSGRFGQREVWERQLTEAAQEIERYRRGLKEASDYLSQNRPGDASFTLEALLVAATRVNPLALVEIFLDPRGYPTFSVSMAVEHLTHDRRDALRQALRDASDEVERLWRDKSGAGG